ncbi:AEC family transporter [Curvibacter sp. PAE-UM]|uniref:AEC family transporter n=1 Tax=Curvibacter sp. PAE-UM TaxID=1714344 RepID=UPI00070CFEB6|nr:AEC family transporter [Curvibacter sp. PAE-UM]KRH98468.1 transporter [Curvibacter sp. PAE-UM]MCZ8292726.1 AEC family transporter [Hylemonella sp.]
MNHPVFSALIPVVLLVALGYVAGRLRWMRADSVKDLSNLVFLVLTPALMFRTMGKVDVKQLELLPLATYFVAVFILFGVNLLWQGLNRRAAVLALASTFSNTVMIGIAFIGLAYGEAGLVVLLALLSLHAVVLLTAGTVILELAVAREAAVAEPRAMWRTVLSAVRNAVIHPVPLPIIAGLLFAQTGWAIPEVVDRPLQWLGNAFGPLALLLVGVTLAGTTVGPHLRGALSLTLVKNLLMPALVAGLGLLMGLSGLPLVVMIVTAALPMGANVFLFSQRYAVAEELVTASVIVSNAVALLTLPLVMWLVGLL